MDAYIVAPLVGVAVPQAAPLVLGTALDGKWLRLSVDKLIDSLDVNLFFAFASLGDIVRTLHPHERVHLHAKGFFDAERHISRKVGFAVEQAR